ncbi:MAG TPA: AI-2E family transporter, partial [Candidatus Gracilibacteria bacterium]|nr:AI-2E family transporter [Candidatus Gracilibacteria bacterium]
MNWLDLSKELYQKLKQIRVQTEENSHHGEKTEKKEKTDPDQEIRTVVVNIPAATVAKATLTIAGIGILVFFLYAIRHVLILFFISLFFSSALGPIVDYLEKKHFPRWLSFLLFILILLVILIAIVGSIIPAIIEQLTSLITSLGNWVMATFAKLQQGQSLEFVPKAYRLWVIKTINSIKLET